MKPEIIPKAFMLSIFSLSKIAEKMNTIIGERVIMTELLTGVDNSKPLKNASIFITIPKKEQRIILGQSFLSILSDLINKLTVQNNNDAPITRKRIKA